MLTIEDAFTDAWRSYRISRGDDPLSLPDPLGAKGQRRQHEGSGDNESAQPVDTGGGFLIDDDDDIGNYGDDEVEREASHQQTRFLPVSFIPDALVNLRLDATDAFVLSLFNEVAISARDAEEAQGAIDGSRRRKRGGASERTERMISTADFARVADVLLDGKAGVETDDEQQPPAEASKSAQSRLANRSQREVITAAERERRSTRPRRAAAKYGQSRYSDALDDDGDELSDPEADEYTNDVIEEADRVEDASSQDDGDNYQSTRSPRTKRIKKIAMVRKAKANDVRSTSGGLRRAARRAKTTDDDEAEQTDEASEDNNERMTSQQRKQALAAFALLTQRLNRITNRQDQPHASRISKADIKLLVQSVGEKIAEREIEEMIEEGVHYFAKASAPDMTREAAKRAREAAAGHATAQGRHDDTLTIGINEFAGILIKGRLI